MTITKPKNKDAYYSIPEYARLVDLSRIAIYKQVVKGKIKAIKIGKQYAIPANYFSDSELTPEQTKEIDEAIKKTIRDFGKTLKMLGNE